MTQHLVDAQLFLFKAQMQWAKTSPEMAGAIEDLVVQVGKLSTRKPEKNQEVR